MKGIPWSRPGHAILQRKYEDEEMNILAGFIFDKGSYPWDVVS
jgi:hypothetical protein